MHIGDAQMVITSNKIQSKIKNVIIWPTTLAVTFIECVIIHIFASDTLHLSALVLLSENEFCTLDKNLAVSN